MASHGNATVHTSILKPYSLSKLLPFSCDESREQAAPLDERDKEERREATARLAADEKISSDTEPYDIFTLKQEQRTRDFSRRERV